MQPLALLRNRKKQLMALAGLLAAVILLRLMIFGPQRVEEVRLVPQDLTAQVYGNGTVEAKVVVNIASKITGRILEVNADQGETVKEGQLLARLDLSELAAQNRQAQATAERASAAAALEKANLQKARASLALAEKNAARFKALAEKELAPLQEAEQYETSFLVAKEEVARASAALNAAQREEAATAAALAASRSRLADATILAPADGIIIRRLLEPGATVTAGLPIFLLADPQTVWVKANVDESQLKGLAPGQPAFINLRSAPGEKFPGQVVRLGWESDRVTEELEVDVAFTPPLATFRLGEQAEVWITVDSRQQAPSLPRNAVVIQNGRRGVWLLEEGRLRFREITTGIEDQQGMIEVTGGLAPQEAVALAPAEKMQRFTEGKRIRVGR